MKVGLSDHVFGRWLFSHEEGGSSVYRPRESAFAPSRRPRDGFDIERDGRFRAYTPGEADASHAADGRWTLVGDGRINVVYDDGRPGVVLEIEDTAPGLLKVRRGKTP